MMNGSQGNPHVIAISLKVQVTAVLGSDNLGLLEKHGL